MSALAAKAAAESARDAALAAFDSFDDRYLGAKSSDPSLDNDGNALVGGALYYNTVLEVMKLYTGSAWVAAYASLSGALSVNNNLSDLTNAGAARNNLGLGNVNNTSDADKPVSTAQQAALDAKAPLNSPTFTGTVGGVSKAMVGLGNVDNTSDANKPVSTAQQTALDAKAPLNSPTFTGTVGGVSKAMVGLGNVDNTSDANKPVSTAQQTALDAKAPLNSPTFTGTVGGVSKAMVGLGNVDNTSDANKPVSTAQQTALDAKAPLNSPTFSGTVGGVSKAMVGLGNVDNTSDMNKPVSTAQQTALDTKQNALDAVSEAEAVEGTATTGRIWSAQRVRQAAEAASALVPLASAVVSSPVAAVEFTGFIDDDRFDEYRLELFSVIPSSHNVLASVYTSLTGSIDYDVGSSDYAYNSLFVTTSAIDAQSDGTSSFKIAGTQGVGSDPNQYGISGTLSLLEPSKPTYTAMIFRGMLKAGGASVYPVPVMTCGYRLSTSPVDALRFAFDSGDIESGTFYLYGVQKP